MEPALGRGASRGAPQGTFSSRPAHARVSRWGDVLPAASPSSGSADPKDRRPSSSGSDPPIKRLRPSDIANPTGSGAAACFRDPYSTISDTLPNGGGEGGAHDYGVPSAGGSLNSGYGGGDQGSGYAPGSAKGMGSLFYKTKLCTKFKIGACTFNENCHFAHGMEDLRKPSPGWENMVASGNVPMEGDNLDRHQPKKTNKPCRYFTSGNCPYGDRCTFLHGDEAPAVISSAGGDAGGVSKGPSTMRAAYKSRMCARWARGEPCNFGDRCHFAHGPAELQGSSEVSGYGARVPTFNSAPDDQQQSLHSNTKSTEVAAYADPSTQTPPAPAASYGQASVNNVWTAPNSVAVGYNSYMPPAGSESKAYGSGQDGLSGPVASFNYAGYERAQQGVNTTSQSYASLQGIQHLQQVVNPTSSQSYVPYEKVQQPQQVVNITPSQAYIPAQGYDKVQYPQQVMNMTQSQPYIPVQGYDKAQQPQQVMNTTLSQAYIPVQGYDKAQQQQQVVNMTPAQLYVPSQGFVQPNQTTQWATNYPQDGVYSNMYQYTQGQGQQSISTSNIYYSGGGSDVQHSYVPYVQGDISNEGTNGSGGYYQGVQHAATYPAQ